jgi:hypothetical protein
MVNQTLLFPYFFKFFIVAKRLRLLTVRDRGARPFPHAHVCARATAPTNILKPAWTVSRG